MCDYQRIVQILKLKNIPYTEEELRLAESIESEVRYAKEFLKDSELALVGTIAGPSTCVSSPHDWWEANCTAYRELAKNGFNTKFYKVCWLASVLIGDLQDELNTRADR